MFSAQRAEEGPLLVERSSELHGSVVTDVVVAPNCSLHIRGNLLGNLTIEPGAKVVVEGSVDGKISNRGGGLVVNNKGLAACFTIEGPAEAEACGVLKIDLNAIVANWETLMRRTTAECAAVVQANAYGCGIDHISGALAKVGCQTFFVSNLPEARQVRTVAPKSTIYVLNGLYPKSGPAFAEINARPVINTCIELAQWEVFVAESGWAGGYALSVDTGAKKRGVPMDEAVALAPKIHKVEGGVTLLMSRLDHAEQPDHSQNERQITRFRELRRTYSGLASSLADSAGIFLGAKAHFDLVRADCALYGLNPLQGVPNPMRPVIELRARVVQVLNLESGDTIADNPGWVAKRRTRLALASIGYADGYPRPENPLDKKMQAIIEGRRCPLAGSPSMDLLPIDVTDLPDRGSARLGESVTLIGDEISVESLAAACKSSGREVLSRLGSRFHRVYYAI
jgi:alanine racemase